MIIIQPCDINSKQIGLSFIISIFLYIFHANDRHGYINLNTIIEFACRANAKRVLERLVFLFCVEFLYLRGSSRSVQREAVTLPDGLALRATANCPCSVLVRAVL